MAKSETFERLYFISSIMDETNGTRHASKLEDGVSLHENLNRVGNYFGEIQQAQAAAFVYKIPYVDFTGWNVAHDQLTRICDPTAIPGFHYVAVDVVDNIVVIACDKPLDPSFKSSLRRILDEEYEYTLLTGDSEQVRALANRAKEVHKTNLSTLGQSVHIHETVVSAAEKFAVAEEMLTAEEIFQRFATVGEQDAKASDLVRALIIQAYGQGASDVHIEPGQSLKESFLVRYRIDGLCVNRGVFSMNLYPQLSTGIKQMSSGMDLSIRGVPQDGRIKVLMKKAGEGGRVDIVHLDIRVACLPTGTSAEWEKFVFRILEGSKNLPTLQEVVGDDKTLKLVTKVLNLPNGLILLTGPTGSGKTTTLARMVTEVNKPDKTIYTVEDPIEYHIPGVTQTQLNEAKKLNFSRILRSHLRMDPDIILVGETRDAETAGIVIKSALTGHLVFSTLHTLDAVGAIPRLIDMGVEHYLLADALSYVAAQRLVQRACPHCLQEENVANEVREQLPEGYRDGKYYRGMGCPKCNQTGYRGRATVLESLYVDRKIRDMIAAHASLHEIRDYNRKYSGNLFEQAVKVAASKKTTLKQAFLLNVDLSQ